MNDMPEENEEFRKIEEEFFKQLPYWAEKYDPSGSLVENRQLCTKDGRIVGNAFIVGINMTMSLKDWKQEPCYKVVTDAGSWIRIIESELHEIFYVGNYIANPNTIPGLKTEKGNINE